MLHLKTRNPAPPEERASSTVPGFGAVGRATSGATFPGPPIASPDESRADAIRKSLQDKWPAEFSEGARSGFLQQREGPRDPGGYPPGFGRWQLERRNAWFAGFNVGFHDRSRILKAVAT
jgi:hypothetical protein